MKQPVIAIVGSGIVGALLAYLFTKKGWSVAVFEKGPLYPYPHQKQFEDEILHSWSDPSYKLPEDIQALTKSGNYAGSMNQERLMLVGGSANRWGAMCDRMHPNDFRTRTLYGYGQDWPISYPDLEPYYSQAEWLLGVSGPANLPFSSYRSRPFPLPPFPWTDDATKIREYLRKDGLILHDSPQARNNGEFDGRAKCVNYGTCATCPTGARYSPSHHLNQAILTGLCKLYPRTSVRKILTKSNRQVSGLLIRGEESTKDIEFSADAVIIAAGALESARLLLLSTSAGAPNGLGNGNGQVGLGFMMNHVWSAVLSFKEKMYAGLSGPEIGQSRQFIDGPERRFRGGVLLQVPSMAQEFPDGMAQFPTERNWLEALKTRIHTEVLGFHCESPPSPDKILTLSNLKDKFGDPFIHVRYLSSAADDRTYEFVTQLLKRVCRACDVTKYDLIDKSRFNSGFHHMGGCRMGLSMEDSVVDSACRVHGVTNLYAIGCGNFPSSTAVHPTLTSVALGLKAAESLVFSTN